jgi:cytoskeletal protein CcmA (bactofilin family)
MSNENNDLNFSDNPPQKYSARIDRTMNFKGDISGDEDLLIEGNVEGIIRLGNGSLTIEKGSVIRADIHAKNVFIRGVVYGNVSALEKVFIDKNACVFGDISAARISILDGAQFKGSMRMPFSNIHSSLRS